jgi:acyl-CoA thioester hydrolase
MPSVQGYELLYRTDVLPDWVDYNGHMSEAFYVLVFGYTTDALLDRIGLDTKGRERENASIYTVEAHVSYIQEVAEGEPLVVGTRILDLDAKRIHAFHAMWHAKSSELLATEELMLLHVRTKPQTAVAPMSKVVFQSLKDLHQAHSHLDWPKQAGRSIGIRRGR